MALPENTVYENIYQWVCKWIQNTFILMFCLCVFVVLQKYEALVDLCSLGLGPVQNMWVTLSV